MLNVLLIQEKSRHKENIGFRECCCLQRAFVSLGQNAEIWGLGWDNFHDLPDFSRYDLIINMENYGDEWLPDLSKVHDPVKMLWTIDSHTRGLRTYTRIFRSGGYDILLQSTKDFVRQDPNRRSIWFPNAVDDTLFTSRGWDTKDVFIGFCGTLLNRQPYLSRLREWFGDEYREYIRVLGPEMVAAIGSFRINFNLNISNDINFRSFETLGVGSVLCTNDNPQYADLGFVDGVNCIIFSHTFDLFSRLVNERIGFSNRWPTDLTASVMNRKNFRILHERLSYYRDNPDELERIAANGIALSRHHTYRERAKLLMKNIGTGRLQGFDPALIRQDV